jgi:WD40 repeat protein
MQRSVEPTLLAVCFFAACSIGHAAEPAAGAPAPVSFFKQIRPMLQRHCQACHQPAKRGGELVLTSVETILKGDKDGAVLAAGKPQESRLLDSLTGANDTSQMPKGTNPLPREQIELFRLWIAQGAKDDTPPAAKDNIGPDNPPVYQGLPLITALAFSPDGQHLAVGGYREVLIHQADGSKLLHRLVGMSQRIESLAFSPDGKLLAAVGGSPGRFGEVQIWDRQTNKLKLSVNVTHDTLYGAAWTNDSQKLAFGGVDNSFRVIEVKEGKQVLKCDHHTDFVIGVAFSLDDKHMVTVSRDRAVKLTQTETGAFIDNITSITPGALKGGLEALERHPKENHVVVGGVDGEPKIYRIFRVQARQIGDDFNLIRAFEKAPGKISDVCFSSDGTMIAAASIGEARVYSVADGSRLATVKFGGGVYAVDFRPDNQAFAAAGFDGMVRIAEARSGKVLKEFVPVPYQPAVAKGR